MEAFGQLAAGIASLSNPNTPNSTTSANNVKTSLHGVPPHAAACDAVSSSRQRLRGCSMWANADAIESLRADLSRTSLRPFRPFAEISFTANRKMFREVERRYKAHFSSYGNILCVAHISVQSMKDLFRIPWDHPTMIGRRP